MVKTSDYFKKTLYINYNVADPATWREYVTEYAGTMPEGPTKVAVIGLADMGWTDRGWVILHKKGVVDGPGVPEDTDRVEIDVYVGKTGAVVKGPCVPDTFATVLEKPLVPISMMFEVPN